MKLAAYPTLTTTVVCSLLTGIGSILGGLITNLPIIVAPPTCIVIFLAAHYLVANKLDYTNGNQAVLFSGYMILLLGYRPIGRLFSQAVPRCIQYATAVGIGNIVIIDVYKTTHTLTISILYLFIIS